MFSLNNRGALLPRFNARIHFRRPLLNYAKELENNVDHIIHHQDTRQCHFRSHQYRAEDCYEEEVYSL